MNYKSFNFLKEILLIQSTRLTHLENSQRLLSKVNFTFNFQILEATLVQMVSITISLERQWVARISQQDLMPTRQ